MFFGRLVRPSLQGCRLLSDGPLLGSHLYGDAQTLVVSQQVARRVVEALQVAPVTPGISLPVEEIFPGIRAEEVVRGRSYELVKCVRRPAFRIAISGGDRISDDRRRRQVEAHAGSWRCWGGIPSTGRTGGAIGGSWRCTAFNRSVTKFSVGRRRSGCGIDGRYRRGRTKYSSEQV